MSNNKYKILVIEDEIKIANLITTILDKEYQVINAYKYEDALIAYKSYNPDLILLDLGLPDKDGINFIEEVRQEKITPIIVLSARTNENDKVLALDMGANDYVTKPFSSAELLARIRSSLRLLNLSSNASTAKFILRDLEIDFDMRRILLNKVELKFTQTEFNIVAFLARHNDKVMTYSSIIKAIWGYNDDSSIKKLQVNMANIRKKLGARPGENNYIINELGIGYRMNDR